MEDKVPFEVVTKLEAAERQLRVAIRLFFERRDLIAVHTLAAASQDIVRQLGRPRGFKGIYEHADERIRPEKKQEFVAHLRAAQNFFKHARKDPKEKLEFGYEATKFYLFDAALLCAALTGRLVPESSAFLGWFMAKYPDTFIDDGDPNIAAAKRLLKGIDLDDFELIVYAIDSLNRGKNAR